MPDSQPVAIVDAEGVNVGPAAVMAEAVVAEMPQPHPEHHVPAAVQVNDRVEPVLCWLR